VFASMLYREIPYPSFHSIITLAIFSSVANEAPSQTAVNDRQFPQILIVIIGSLEENNITVSDVRPSAYLSMSVLFAPMESFYNGSYISSYVYRIAYALNCANAKRISWCCKNAVSSIRWHSRVPTG